MTSLMYLIFRFMLVSSIAAGGLASKSIASPIALSGAAPARKMVINSFTKVSLACASNSTNEDCGVGGTAGVPGPAGIAGTAGVLVPPQAHHGLAGVPGTAGVPGMKTISRPNLW